MTIAELFERAGRPRIAVTGAGGFVGRRVVAAAVAAGIPVVALLRSGHDAAALRSAGAEVRIGNFTDRESISGALRDVDVLVHLAYDVRATGQVNLALLQAVLAAALHRGLRRIVHASSAVVYDGWPDGPMDEDSAIGAAPEGSYRWAKIAMETLLLDAPMEVAILQPTIVYGPGSPLWTDGPIAMLRRGDVVLPEPSGTCPALHVDDLADAVLRAALVPLVGRRRFLVSGSETLTWETFWRGLAGVAGKGNVLLRPQAELSARLGPAKAPSGPARPSAAARVSAVLRRLLGRHRFEALRDALLRLKAPPGPAYPDRGSLALFSGRPEVSIERAGRELGFVPRVRFAEGLAQIRAKSG